MKELKSNTRLSGFMSLIVLMWLGLFAYMTFTYMEAKDFTSFLTSGLVSLILCYTFLRTVSLFFSNVMEIRRHELIRDVREANERWGRR
jgi:hypothetical protein